MRLSFDDELGKRHFEFCFVGFVLGGSLQEKKGMTVLRREMALFEKLESVSEPMPCGKKLHNGEPQRQLANHDTPLAIDIDMTEFDLLYGYVSAVPWQTGTPTRMAVETLDWLQAASRS